MNTTKERKTYRLSPRTILLLQKLMRLHDCTETHIIEEAVREKAKRENVADDAFKEETL